jgi:predicted nuclease of predicted toxin-antitoxin system
MKFLVDAQLPLRLARLLQEAGYDTIHTKELPQQNATPDSIINSISIQEERVVLTKAKTQILLILSSLCSNLINFCSLRQEISRTQT